MQDAMVLAFSWTPELVDNMNAQDMKRWAKVAEIRLKRM